MKLATAIIAIAVLASAAQPAIAQTAPDQTARTVRVAYADLNLQSAQGQEVLQKRIRTALRMVCPRPDLPASLREIKTHRECIAVAKEGTEVQLARLRNNRRLALNAITIDASGGWTPAHNFGGGQVGPPPAYHVRVRTGLGMDRSYPPDRRISMAITTATRLIT